MQYLVELGVAREQAVWINNWLCDNGSLFVQWGVHPKIAQLLCNLHDGAWLAYADLCSVVLCPRGGSQGCGSGPLVLNCVYSIATNMVKDALQKEGLTSQWQSPHSAWCDSNPEYVAQPKSSLPLPCGHEGEKGFVTTSDIYFVDDA